MLKRSSRRLAAGVRMPLSAMKPLNPIASELVCRMAGCFGSRAWGGPGKKHNRLKHRPNPKNALRPTMDAPTSFIFKLIWTVFEERVASPGPAARGPLAYGN